MNEKIDISKLSNQEAAMAQGKKALRDNITDRVMRLFERARTAEKYPRISLDRAVLFTESFKQTEGQLTVLRWAKALLHTTQNLPIRIFEDELIVGRPNSWFGKHGMIYPELDASLMPETLKIWRKSMAEGKPDAVNVTEEDEKIMMEVIYPYWAGRDFAPNFLKALPEESRLISFGPDPDNVAYQTLLLPSSQSMRHSQGWAIDHGKLLERGCKGLREDAQARLDALEHPIDALEKKPFLEAVILTCDALTTWARRYAEHARELAAKEKNAERRAELLEIADVCEWVPENPPRTFREALQAQWFSQCMSRLEEFILGDINQGRMDQYLYPYYKADIEAGRITEDGAIELFHCMWVNMMQHIQLTLSPSLAMGREGFSHHETVCIGGQTRTGEDATNDLTYVLLESTRGLKTSYPEVAARIHANTPDRFLRALVETSKDGKGSPKVINDEFVIPMYIAQGVPMEDAMDYTTEGCVETRMVNRDTHKTGNSGVNFGFIIESVLRNGRVKCYDDFQYGLQTGDPRGFETYEQVWEAFKTQLENSLKHIMIQGAVGRKMKSQYFAAPYASMMHDLCTAACMDIQRHDEGIPGGMDLSCIEALGGFGTAIDALAAIKTLIFEQKRITWDQLLNALEKNWEGEEAIRQLCLNAPKYGNGIEWVDQIGRDIMTVMLDYAARYPKPNGKGTVVRIVPITFHVAAGSVTFATPTGRPAGEFLSEGISPAHGMDVKGPTVALGSIAKATSVASPHRGPMLINMKFSPANLAGEEGARRLMQVIRTWCDLKLWHIQFNVINRDTLIAAQKDPEKYRDLVVRIAGYCAYFVDLSPMQQEEILKRTEEEAA